MHESAPIIVIVIVIILVVCFPTIPLLLSFHIGPKGRHKSDMSSGANSVGEIQALQQEVLLYGSSGFLFYLNLNYQESN